MLGLRRGRASVSHDATMRAGVRLMLAGADISWLADSQLDALVALLAGEQDRRLDLHGSEEIPPGRNSPFRAAWLRHKVTHGSEVRLRQGAYWRVASPSLRLPTVVLDEVFFPNRRIHMTPADLFAEIESVTP